jgi:3-oxoacyl-(acyl-carrier-protein) synthase
MTVDSMVRKLLDQGLLTERLREGLASGQLGSSEVWEALTPELRRQAMNESSAPFGRYAKGLVVAEGAAALPWVNFQRAIELGLWPSSRLLGIHVNSGEGGASNLASMDQGVVTATLVAMNQARAHGRGEPQLWQAHGTSTELNNIAEVMSLYQAFRYSGLSRPVSVSAVKGLVGHTMGAASAIDMVMGVQSLLDGEAPGLFNFRIEDRDPRYLERVPEVLKQFNFSQDPIRGGIETLLITSEGFMSADAAAVLGHFPQDPQAAQEMLRDYGVPEHQRAEWRSRAEEHRARAEEWDENLRRRRWTYRDLVEAARFRP